VAPVALLLLFLGRSTSHKNKISQRLRLFRQIQITRQLRRARWPSIMSQTHIIFGHVGSWASALCTWTATGREIAWP